MEAHRVLVRDGIALVIKENKHKQSLRNLFLFNDMLIIGKRNLRSGLKLKFKIILVSASIVPSAYHKMGM